MAPTLTPPSYSRANQTRSWLPAALSPELRTTSRQTVRGSRQQPILTGDCQVCPTWMLSAGLLLGAEAGWWLIPLPDELDGTCWFQGFDVCTSASKILGNGSISGLAEDSHAHSQYVQHQSPFSGSLRSQIRFPSLPEVPGIESLGKGSK